MFATQLSFYSVLARTPYIRRKFIEYALRYSTTYRDLDFGGFLFLKRDRLQMDLAIRDSIFAAGKPRAPNFGKAKDQVEYLDKIIDLCKERNVMCILLNTPVHSVIVRDADTAAYYTYWKEHLAGTTLYDHSAWQLPDSCYADATHLNHSGAALYSERLRQLRSKGWPPLQHDGRMNKIPPILIQVD